MTVIPKMLAKIINADDNFGILLPEVTGVEQGVQAIRVDVYVAGQDVTRHIIVSAHYPQMELSLCERLEARLSDYFGGIIVSFTMTSEEGEVDVFSPSVQKGHCSLRSVAADVAVVKRSWGWDESDWIEVRYDARKEQIKVSPAYDGEKWVIETWP